ncbi:hypothetical protein PybrP1_012333, partial [[Pythium] brassicae (nom. inval.)]
MLRKWLVLAASFAVVATQTASGDIWDARVDALIANFTVDDILGQMTQIDMVDLVKSDGTLNEDKIRAFAKLRIGSYLNSPFSGGPTNG